MQLKPERFPVPWSSLQLTAADGRIRCTTSSPVAAAAAGAVGMAVTTEVVEVAVGTVIVGVVVAGSGVGFRLTCAAKTRTPRPRRAAQARSLRAVVPCCDAVAAGVVVLAVAVACGGHAVAVVGRAVGVLTLGESPRGPAGRIDQASEES